MRKLMWFSVGFAAACAAGVYLQMNILCLILGIVCLAGLLTSLFFSSKPAKIAATLSFGVLIGLLWLLGYHGLYLSTAKAYDSETVLLTVTASDYSYESTYGHAFDGYTELDSKRYQVRCYLNEERQVTPGERIEARFRLRYTAAGGEKEPTYHQGKGIFLIASQQTEATVTAGEPRIADYPAIWRQKLLTLLNEVFPQDAAAFAKALLLGDTTDFTYAQDRAFQVSGLRHVVAVSGLHVSILFALVYMAFGQRRILNAVFGIPLLLLFAAVAGFTPSIVRACIMQALILLAMLADREYDPPTALAFSALVILAVNPMAITSVSLQLSVSCMIGIFAFSEPLREYFLSFGKLREKCKGKSCRAKLIRWLTGSVAVTLSAMFVTTPLCAIHFGMVSLVGILSNLLTLWIISFTFYGIMIAAAAGMLWLPMGKVVAWVIAWPIRYVLAAAGLLGKFPLAAVYTDSIYIVFWLVFAYVLLAAFFLTKKKHPAITAVGIAAMLCLCVALSWVEPTRDEMRVSVIDVGQGQCVLIRSGDSQFLVDCGGSHPGITADTVANYLLSQGIFHLDGIILTHYDKDHGGSVTNLLACVDADRIYMPDLTDSNGIRQQIEGAFPEKIILTTEVSEIYADGGKFTLFPGKQMADDNESSTCVLFQRENCDILITGDRSAAGERALLAQTQLPKLELLVAGHHGANTATSLELLYATQPEAVAISVSENNLYGHPKQEMLDRVSRFGCAVYRTDQLGTITFRR